MIGAPVAGSTAGWPVFGSMIGSDGVVAAAAGSVVGGS